jgi:hypothetical protein
MSQERQVILIIEAKDGAKYQGNFVSKDTEKLLITLSNVTKTFEGKDETHPLCEIKKEDIAKISMIENKPKKDEVENINEIPVNKKTDNNVVNVEKVYDRSKDDFFDQLKTATNSDMKSVANFYNKKNADTFKLTQNEIDDDNDNKNMGRKRGRGRGFRGGFRGGNNRGRGGYDYNNKFNNYQGNNNNNRNSNQQYNNYNNNYVNYGNNNYRNGNHRGYNNNYHRGRGNYQKNKNFHNGGNAQNYNKFNQNYNNQGNNGNNNQV